MYIQLIKNILKHQKNFCHPRRCNNFCFMFSLPRHFLFTSNTWSPTNYHKSHLSDTCACTCHSLLDGWQKGGIGKNGRFRPECSFIEDTFGYNCCYTCVFNNTVYIADKLKYMFRSAQNMLKVEVVN